MYDKPFSQACENNKDPILNVIRQYFIEGMVLEIGSGTGQHSVYFAKHLPNIYWQTSDQQHYHDGIKQWLAEYDGNNLGKPRLLDVNQPVWPVENVSGVFSANTAHIMDWDSVKQMFSGVAGILSRDGYFCLYGPVNVNGVFTSDSNASFDMSLRAHDLNMGIRNLEDLQSLARANELQFVELHQMPANNVLMVWQHTIA